MRGVSSPTLPRVSVYLESRYRKLVRGLPQTTLFCPKCKDNPRKRGGCPTCGGRGRLAEDSVGDIVGRVLRRTFQARDGKFHGAGREDVDVLMLGRGRPFVFEVVGAKLTDVDLTAALADIHAAAGGRIEVAPFQPCDRDRVVFWKAVQLEKTYRARVALAGPPPVAPVSLVGRTIAIEQRTPQRVAHRRGDTVRVRWVEVRAVEARSELAFDLDLRCAHGTYVKEWISGDAGRTTPSLASLLEVGAVCELLDVLDVVDVTEAAVRDDTGGARPQGG